MPVPIDPNLYNINILNKAVHRDRGISPQFFIYHGALIYHRGLDAQLRLLVTLLQKL